MEAIEKILNKKIKKMGLDTRIKEKSIFLYWKQIMGDLAKHSSPAYINNGVLFINVPHSAWAHNMQFFKNNILKKINGRLKGYVIKDIRFRCGRVNFDTDDLEQKPDRDLLENIDLTERELKKIEQVSQLIRDDNLKIKFKQILSKDYKLKKWKALNWKKCKKCQMLHNEKGDLCHYCRLKNKT